jgi:hypothetical protein
MIRKAILVMWVLSCLKTVACAQSERAAAKSYDVFKVNRQTVVDGTWEKDAWRDIKPLSILNYMGSVPGFRPTVQAKMTYDDQNLYVIFKVDDRYVRSVTTGPNGPVWRDSAVEFFFSPGSAGPENYFNLEINCGGTALMQFHHRAEKRSVSLTPEELGQIEIAHSLPGIVDPELTGPVTWTIECRIPLKLLAKFADVTVPAPGVKWRANFYKIAENTSNPHYITWSPIDHIKPNFHLPRFFGTLEFQ